MGLGFEGAAVVNAIISIAYMAYVIVMAYRLTGTAPNPRLLLHLVAAGLAAAVLTLTLSIWTIQQWYELAAFGFYAIGVFFAFLALFKELTLTDIKYLLSIINPGMIAGYVTDEVRQKEKEKKK